MTLHLTRDISAAATLAQAQKVGPGSKLKAARQRFNLSVADVATKLYLTQTVLMAIEEDNYSNLPGVTFIRGYLRSYARILRLNTEEIINDFNQLGLQDNPAHMSTPEIYRKRASFTEKTAPWISSLVVLIFIFIAIFWWHRHNEHVEATLTLNSSVPAISAISTMDSMPHLGDNAKPHAPLAPAITAIDSDSKPKKSEFRHPLAADVNAPVEQSSSQDFSSNTNLEKKSSRDEHKTNKIANANVYHAHKRKAEIAASNPTLLQPQKAKIEDPF